MQTNKPKISESITKSNFPDGVVNCVSSPRSIVFGGRRVVVGLRVDEGLYADFKAVAKRRYGSVCKPIEAFMATVVSLDRVPNVDFGSIVIENQTIERNQTRERRNLHFVSCEVAGCREPAVSLVEWSGKVFQMCRFHVEYYERLRSRQKGKV